METDVGDVSSSSIEPMWIGYPTCSVGDPLARVRRRCGPEVVAERSFHGELRSIHLGFPGPMSDCEHSCRPSLNERPAA
jgi:hypothetical protein